jgi:crossover junction endodeoxyribonuclease RuvC
VHVIGLDPGSRYTGYGIVEKKGQTLRHVTSGRINAVKAGDFADRLEVIYGALSDILAEFPCSQASMESIFTARNAMSSLKLGHARGVSMLALRHAELSVSEYAPAKVKQAVAGHGRARKDDVARMVKLVLQIPDAPLSEDASDALAVAICHCQMLDFERRLEPGDRP